MEKFINLYSESGSTFIPVVNLYEITFNLKCPSSITICTEVNANTYRFDEDYVKYMQTNFGSFVNTKEKIFTIDMGRQIKTKVI